MIFVLRIICNLNIYIMHMNTHLKIFIHFLVCSVIFRHAQDKRYTKSTHQIRMHALLISKTYQRIAVALCLHVSACNLNKRAQIPLQFYWSPVIVSVFGTELDSWGCCLHVTLWVGITIGSKLQAMVAEFYLYSMHYQAQHLAHKSVCKAHNPGLRFRSKHDKRASEVNKGGCSC